MFFLLLCYWPCSWFLVSLRWFCFCGAEEPPWHGREFFVFCSNPKFRFTMGSSVLGVLHLLLICFRRSHEVHHVFAFLLLGKIRCLMGWGKHFSTFFVFAAWKIFYNSFQCFRPVFSQWRIDSSCASRISWRGLGSSASSCVRRWVGEPGTTSELPVRGTQNVSLQSTEATDPLRTSSWMKAYPPPNPPANTMFMAAMAMVLPWKIVEDF